MGRRRQVSQRYLARMYMSGASLDKIADGAYNPLKRTRYVTSQDNTDTASNSGLWVPIIIGVIGAIVFTLARLVL